MKYKTVVQGVGIFSVFIGVSVILGWVFDIAVLKSGVPGYNTMKVNAALCLLMSGVALYAQTINSLTRRAFWPTLFVGILSAASLAQDVLGFNFGIDEFIVADISSTEGVPGRMATTTAISFLLTAIAFLLIRKKALQPTGQVLCNVVMLIAFIALLGYFFKVPTLYKLSFLSSMALHTSISLFILSIGLSLVNSNIGLAGMLTGNGIGSKIARRLLPRMLGAIVLFGYLGILSHRLNLVTAEFGIALFSISFVLVGLGLIWDASKWLNIIDAERSRAEEATKRTNQQLEVIVAKRTLHLEESLGLLKQQELTLRRNQELIKGIIDNAGSAIFVKDRGGRYLLANSKFASNFGLSPESIKMKSAFDLFPSGVAEQLINDESEIFDKAASSTSQTQLTATGKEKVTMLTNKFPLFDETNTVYAIGVIATDITAQKKAEANLKAIFDSALVSIIETDPTGVITHFNRGAEILLGYSKDEMIGKQTPALIHVDQEITARGKELSLQLHTEVAGFDVFVELARRNTFDSREWTYVRKNGSRFPVQLVVTTIRAEDNSIQGFLGIATDISQLKDQRVIIEKQNKDLELLNATKDRFFSIVAHDLKSPLNSLRAFTTLIVDHTEHLSKDEIQDMGLKLKTSLDNTIKMADNLIMWARLQMNESSQTIESIVVEDIVANVCDVYRAVAIEKGISVSCNTEETHRVRGDRNQVEFIIRNLVNNAIKFTETGGSVSVNSKLVDAEHIQISVSDSGVGMSKEMVDRLFLIGTKQSLKGTAGEQGTGLGLMLCYEFANKNGGTLQVDSVAGEGSTFRVKLKRA